MVDRKNRAHALTARRGEKRSSCARSQFRPPQGSRSPSAELAAANAWLDRDDEAKAAIDGLHELMPVQRRIVRKRYEKGTALVAAYSPRLKRIGIQNWRRASTVAGMSRQAFDAQRGVAKGIAGRPASSTQWNRIGRSR